MIFFFFQAEDGIRDDLVTGVQTCALPIFITFTVSFSMCRIASEVRIESGIEMQTINVLRQLPRKSRIMSAVSSAAMTASLSTPWIRSEERRVGKECRSRWSPYH